MLDKWLKYVKEKYDKRLISGWELDIPPSYIFCDTIKILARIIEKVEQDKWGEARTFIPLLCEKVVAMLLLAPQYIHQYLLDKAERNIKEGYEKGKNYEKDKKFLCNAIELFAMYMRPSFDSEMLFFYGEIAGCLGSDNPLPPPPP